MSQSEKAKILSNGLIYEIIPTGDKNLATSEKDLIRNKSELNFINQKDDEVSEKTDKLISTKRGVINQILITCAVLLLSAACGMPIGYSAVLLPQLYNSSEAIKIDIEMGSWIASVHSLSTPVGSFVSGSIADRFGRKTTLIIAVIPLIIGWTFLAMSQTYTHLLIGRVIAGAAVGILGAPAQVLIAEVAEPKLRSLLIGAPYVSYSIGILIVYLLGSLFHWRIVAWSGLVLPILAAIALFRIPESPAWLVRNNKKNKAFKALLTLRGDETIANRELNDLIVLCENEKNQTTNENIIQLCMQRIAIKPLLIVNIFNVLQLFSGTFLVVFYANDIISEFGGDVDANKASVLTSVVRVACTTLFCFLLLIIRRRTILNVSGLGSGISCLALGFYLMTRINEPRTEFDIYFASICMILYIAFNTPLMVIPGVMIGELFPGKIRGRIGGWIFALFNVLLFGLTKVFPLVKTVIKTHGMFIMFGVGSLLAWVFIFFTLPETKGKQLTEIEEYFSQDNWFWVTRNRKNKKIDGKA
ncbi:hypothetical protein ACFFRR_000395 [Megaselia abdita]